MPTDSARVFTAALSWGPHFHFWGREALDPERVLDGPGPIGPADNPARNAAPSGSACRPGASRLRWLKRVLLGAGP